MLNNEKLSWSSDGVYTDILHRSSRKDLASSSADPDAARQQTSESVRYTRLDVQPLAALFHVQPAGSRPSIALISISSKMIYRIKGSLRLFGMHKTFLSSDKGSN